MKFARLGPVGGERPALVAGDGYLDLSAVVTDIDASFWEEGGPERVAAALAAGTLPPLDADGLRVGPPIARPGSVVCIGMNYAAHAAESGAQPPSAPVIFFKASNTVAGPDDDVTIPRGSKKTDWEVELGVVIGRRASYLDTVEEALGHIGGFVLANDLSEREFQIEISGGQWSKGKTAPGFSPLGPWLATPDEVDYARLGLRSFVNGEPRQDSSTSDMIFDVPTLVYQLSQYMVLDPGDVILTGTPEGVGLSGRFPYLKPGDIMELEIDGLGRQRQRLVAWEPGR